MKFMPEALLKYLTIKKATSTTRVVSIGPVLPQLAGCTLIF